MGVLDVAIFFLIMGVVYLAWVTTSCSQCLEYREVCYRRVAAGFLGGTQRVKTPCEHKLWDEKVKECVLTTYGDC